MIPFIARALVAALLLIGPVPTALGQAADGPTFELSVAGTQPTTITRQELATLPLEARDVSFQSSKGEVKNQYEGVLVWTVLQRFAPSLSADPRTLLKHSIIVTASDGYGDVFSAGEMMPDFGNAPIMIALRAGGKELDSFRIIVPGDKRGARNVRDVVGIEVR